MPFSKEDVDGVLGVPILPGLAVARKAGPAAPAYALGGRGYQSYQSPTGASVPSSMFQGRSSLMVHPVPDDAYSTAGAPLSMLGNASTFPASSFTRNFATSSHRSGQGSSV